MAILGVMFAVSYWINVRAPMFRRVGHGPHV